jgi:hypothetical protein
MPYVQFKLFVLFAQFAAGSYKQVREGGAPESHVCVK